MVTGCVLPETTVSIFHRYLAALVFALLYLPAMAFAQAPPQAAGPLPALQARLEDHRGLAQDHAFVFLGSVSLNRTIPRPTCKAGVEHRIAYRVTEVLWAEPDSPVVPDYSIEKGFIYCAQKQLPIPQFAVGAKVIVFCGLRLGFFQCLPPVLFTGENLRTIQVWLKELFHEEGDPALLRIHEALLQSAALLRKRAAISAAMVNDHQNRPFVFVGSVTNIEKLPQFPAPMSVIPRRHMDVSVSQVLWGEFNEPVVHAWCNSRACGGAALNEEVILHCSPAPSFDECSSPAPFSEGSLKKVQFWIAEISQK